MRGDRTIILAARSSRVLCYVSENKGICFDQRSPFEDCELHTNHLSPPTCEVVKVKLVMPGQGAICEATNMFVFLEAFVGSRPLFLGILFHLPFTHSPSGHDSGHGKNPDTLYSLAPNKINYIEKCSHVLQHHDQPVENSITQI